MVAIVGRKRDNWNPAASTAAAAAAVAAVSPADVQRQTAVEATSAGIALLVGETLTQGSCEDVGARRTAGVAVDVVVGGGGSCSWPVAEFATGFAGAGLEDPRWKVRSWAVVASSRLLVTSALGHMATNPYIGLVQ